MGTLKVGTVAEQNGTPGPGGQGEGCPGGQSGTCADTVLNKNITAPEKRKMIFRIIVLSYFKSDARITE